MKSNIGLLSRCTLPQILNILSWISGSHLVIMVVTSSRTSFVPACIVQILIFIQPWITLTLVLLFIPAKPLHIYDTDSVHFNHFYYTEICDKLSSDLAIIMCIYLNVEECLLTSSMQQQRFKHQLLLIYAENIISED